MQITFGKILALAIALAACGISFAHTGTVTMKNAEVAVGMLLPLALIWFPEELGSMTGDFSGNGNIDVPTPGFLVSMAGWLLLVGVPAILYWMAQP